MKPSSHKTASSDFRLKKVARTLPALGTGTEERALPQRIEPAWTEDGPPTNESFLDYGRLLFAHKATLLIFALTGLAAAVLIGWVQTPLYRTRTSLEVQNLNENFLDLKSVDPTVTGEDMPTGPSYLQTQLVMLQSDTLLGRVIDKLNVHVTRPARFGRARRMLGLSDAPHVWSKEELIQQARANLSVRAARDTRVLEILYESPNPKSAADFANTLVNEFIEQTQEMRLKAFQRTAERLTVQLREMKGKLEQSEGQLQDYVRTAGLTFISDKDNVSDVRLVELQAQLSKAQGDRIDKEARLNLAQRAPVDSLPELLDDPTLREYRVRLIDLQRQLVDLTATLTPEHYKVQRVQAQVTELEHAIQNQRDLMLRRIGNEYQAARRREQSLADSYANQQKVVTDQSSKEIRYRTLKGEVDSTRQLYEAMLARVKQAELASAMRATNVLVIDPAAPPTQPYRPHLATDAALGLFGGVFLGLGFIFFRERFDRRIHAPGEAHVYLQVTELGVTTATERTGLKELEGADPTSLALFPSRHVTPRSELALFDHNGSLSEDCYRSIVASMLLANHKRDNPGVIVVTSPCAGDGKTTVAGNLSIATVEIGKKVLLVDGDLRRPGLHEFFGVSNSEGLSTLLCSNSSLGDSVSLERHICQTKIPGLYVLPAGRGTANSARLVHSVRMSGLLERLRKRFDMVIIDTPPVIAVPDARVLGRLADGVVLVIRAGQTTIENALLARQRFAEDGTRVLGTVLNGWNPKNGRRYGYGGPERTYGVAG